MFELGESISLLPRTCHTASIMIDQCFVKQNFDKKIWQTMTIACLALAAKNIEKDERKHYIRMLIEESKLNIERNSVVASETAILQLLNWKIPN